MSLSYSSHTVDTISSWPTSIQSQQRDGKGGSVPWRHARLGSELRNCSNDCAFQVVCRKPARHHGQRMQMTIHNNQAHIHTNTHRHTFHCARWKKPPSTCNRCRERHRPKRPSVQLSQTLIANTIIDPIRRAQSEQQLFYNYKQQCH